eukprot:CAMPEP_0184694396 /NCGR_PEP_ID=MMETSP0313-20130426/2378_1 /TAXON_ID=2792 /ORGANISM="Porphyridium aerugineum, Strain SAG 1380-2" /LENGTH=668 /DNA_ID=CAMNT_0027152687 /DNA_START=240 /DNA_END=2246 /DNA_ORIENTATION=+
MSNLFDLNDIQMPSDQELAQMSESLRQDLVGIDWDELALPPQHQNNNNNHQNNNNVTNVHQQTQAHLDGVVPDDEHDHEHVDLSGHIDHMLGGAGLGDTNYLHNNSNDPQMHHQLSTPMLQHQSSSQQPHQDFLGEVDAQIAAQLYGGDDADDDMLGKMPSLGLFNSTGSGLGSNMGMNMGMNMSPDIYQYQINNGNNNNTNITNNNNSNIPSETYRQSSEQDVQAQEFHAEVRRAQQVRQYQQQLHMQQQQEIQLQLQIQQQQQQLAQAAAAGYVIQSSASYENNNANYARIDRAGSGLSSSVPTSLQIPDDTEDNLSQVLDANMNLHAPDRSPHTPTARRSLGNINGAVDNASVIRAPLQSPLGTEPQSASRLSANPVQMLRASSMIQPRSPRMGGNEVPQSLLARKALKEEELTPLDHTGSPLMLRRMILQQHANAAGIASPRAVASPRGAPPNLSGYASPRGLGVIKNEVDRFRSRDSSRAGSPTARDLGDWATDSDRSASEASSGASSASDRSHGIRKVRSRRKPRKKAEPGESRLMISSKTCHGCGHVAKSRSAACSNVTLGTCRKIFCERCLLKTHTPEQVDQMVSPDYFFICFHCAGTCPPGAQCFYYNATQKPDAQQAQPLQQQQQQQQQPQLQHLPAGMSVDPANLQDPYMMQYPGQY